MRKIVSIITSLMLFGCASNSQSSGVVPNWVLQPNEYCNEGYICGVGEGRNIILSSAEARNEIAKQFKVNVKGNFSSTISQNNGKDDINVNDAVNELTDEILEGINIKETYIDKDGRYYTYATLDKSKIINDLKFEIDNYDTQMKLNLGHTPFRFRTTKKLFEKREELNKKYLFLTGKELIKKVKLEDIFNAKGSPIVYKIEINDKTLGIEKSLINNILENKDKVDNKTQKPDRIIRGEVKAEQAYLNVSGFEKYSIVVELECLEGGKSVGSIRLDTYKTGRSKAQVFENVKTEIAEYIDKNVDSLLG